MVTARRRWRRRRWRIRTTAAAVATTTTTTTVVFFINCGDILLCPLPIWYQLFNHQPFRRSVGLLVQEIGSLQGLHLTAYRNTKTRA